MSEPDVLDMHEAADEAGVHYDTLRKNWRAWANPAHRDYCAFPMPFRAPPVGRRGGFAWRRSAVAEWKQARERALGARFVTPPTYRHDAATAAHLAARRDPTIHHQRAALARLMERA